MKKWVITLIFVFALSIYPIPVQAEDREPIKTFSFPNFFPNKTFTVTFSEPIDQQSLNIYATRNLSSELQKYRGDEKPFISVNPNNPCQVIIKPPLLGWPSVEGANIDWIVIEKSNKSKLGKNLNMLTLVSLIPKTIQKIDLEVSNRVKVGELVPLKVTHTYEDGTTSEFTSMTDWVTTEWTGPDMTQIRPGYRKINIDSKKKTVQFTSPGYYTLNAGYYANYRSNDVNIEVVP